MKLKIAYAFSVICHPLLLPTFLFAVLMSYAPFTYLPFRWPILLSFFISTFLIPGLGIGALYWLGKVSDLNLFDRRERFFPMLSTAILYSISVIMLFTDGRIPATIIAVYSGITISIILTWLITMFWKISAHAVAIGGFLGTVLLTMLLLEIEQLMLPFSLFVLIGGLTLSSRLKLGAHTGSQIAAGFILGLGTSSLLLFVY